MGSVGFEEMLVIAIVAIIVWGDNLPQMARKAARMYAQLRNYMMQVRDEVIKNIPDEKDILPDLKDVLPPPQSMPIYMDESDPDYKKPEILPPAAPPPADPKPPEPPAAAST